MEGLTYFEGGSSALHQRTSRSWRSWRFWHHHRWRRCRLWTLQCQRTKIYDTEATRTYISFILALFAAVVRVEGVFGTAPARLRTSNMSMYILPLINGITHFLRGGVTGSSSSTDIALLTLLTLLTSSSLEATSMLAHYQVSGWEKWKISKCSQLTF